MNSPQLIEMSTPSTPAESTLAESQQSSRRKFPRRNACTASMLMNDSATVSEPLHSSPMPFDKDNYNSLFGKTTCPTPLIPVVSDPDLNKCSSFPLKRSMDNHHVESGNDVNCTENDLRLTVAYASLRQHKRRRVSPQVPANFPSGFQIEKDH
jgi:hypothetical protein